MLAPNVTPATIAHLRARKQRFKLKMFERLYYILLFAVLIIAIFFVVSTMSFSGRLAEGEYLFFILFCLIMVPYLEFQTIPREPGVIAGGYWMAILLSYTSRASSASRFCGVQVKTTEDKFLLLLYNSPVLILYPFLYIGYVR